jgi:hypothetical protein
MMGTDRTQVLKMVEAGQVSAAEGARLLGAVAQPDRPVELSNRWLRVRVTDLHTQRPKVTVNLPLSWVEVGLRIGAHYHPDLAGVDLKEIMKKIDEGAEGRLVEVEDETSDERIEVFVD